MDSVKALVAQSKTDPGIGESVYIQVRLTDEPTTEQQHSPLLLPLPHKFRKKSDITVCLVVKDPASPVEAKLAQSPVTADLFDEVIGVGKLRRRVAGGKRNTTTKLTTQFTKAFTLICVQHKVVEPLVECLGPKFFKTTTTLPVPVSLQHLDSDTAQRKLKLIVKTALQSAQIVMKPKSKVLTILVGDVKMDTKKLFENIVSAVDQCKRKIPSSLGYTAEYYIKTQESIALKFDTE